MRGYCVWRGGRLMCVEGREVNVCGGEVCGGKEVNVMCSVVGRCVVW